MASTRDGGPNQTKICAKPKAEEMRIVLAGMKECPNQFSRGIERAGCEVIHLGTYNKPIPSWADAVVVAKCQVSHALFWAAKDWAKRNNKPMFVTNDSFAKIANEFIAFVEHEKTIRLSATAIGKAFVDAGAARLPRVRIIAETPVEKNDGRLWCS